MDCDRASAVVLLPRTSSAEWRWDESDAAATGLPDVVVPGSRDVEVLGAPAGPPLALVRLSAGPIPLRSKLLPPESGYASFARSGVLPEAAIAISQQISVYRGAFGNTEELSKQSSALSESASLLILLGARKPVVKPSPLPPLPDEEPAPDTAPDNEAPLPRLDDAPARSC